MDLVDEQHVIRLQRRQDARQVAGFVEHRARGNLEAHTQFVGDDVAQGGLSQSWRTVQQSVVKRFATVFGRLDEHVQVVHHFLLPAEIPEP